MQGSCPWLFGPSPSLQPRELTITTSRRRCCWWCSWSGNISWLRETKVKEVEEVQHTRMTLASQRWWTGYKHVEWGILVCCAIKGPWEYSQPLWPWKDLHRTADLRTFAQALQRCSHSRLCCLCLLLKSLLWLSFFLLLLLLFFFFFFFWSFVFLGPHSWHNVCSQARGRVGATAVRLPHSHRNTRSKPRLQPTPQLMATPDP